MALRKTTVAGVSVKRGEKMLGGKGWRLTTPYGRTLPATLIKRLNIGGESVAIFRVLPHPDKK